jgi:tRNA1Val (adenine37-N6)-methyltransferase
MSGKPIDQTFTRAMILRQGWEPGGPEPRGDAGDPLLWPADDEDLSFLSGNFRIFQKKRGHRWSLDDALTAVVAIETARDSALYAEEPARLLDLGTGIGSVSHMLAWAFPNARVVGIEAQELSYGMALRSRAYNGLEQRMELLLGDLRLDLPEDTFDMVTGTPPYIPIGEGVISERPQKGPCCFEFRGGVEDYCAAARRALKVGGAFVVCEGLVAAGRTEAAAAANSFRVARRVDAIPKEGKAPLFQVFVLIAVEGEKTSERAPMRVDPFVVRSADGKYTEDNRHMRKILGMPPLR